MDDLFIKAFQKIQQANNILIVTHINPDGDAIASVCAIAELLELYKKKYFAYCHNQPPQYFNFLPHIDKVSYFKEKEMFFDDFDLIIVLDCGSLARTTLTKEIAKRNISQLVIEFDHHPRVDNYSNIELRNPIAASTTEVIYNFLKANGIPLNKNLATCILTGIITDTGIFFYPTTSEETIKAGAEMLLHGANLKKIIEKSLKNKNLNTLKSWGKIIDNLKVNKKHGIAVATMSLDDYVQSSLSEDELEGFSGFLSNLSEVKAILFIRETEEGVIKGSLRTSLPGVDVSRLARLLGGGGHIKASGFTLKGKLILANNSWKIE